MMESSQPVLNPSIPEIDNANETNPDAETPNESEESKNEMTEQQEGGILYQVTEEEDPVKTLYSNEGEEPPLIPDKKRSVPSSIKENLVYSRRQSQRSTTLSQRSQPSAGRQSLRSPMPLELQPPKDVGPKGSVAWLNQRTGKEMKCKFNQTSLIWERKPLAEILHPSSETPEMSQNTGKDETDAGETVAPAQDAEIEPVAKHRSAHSMQPSEGAGGREGSPSPVIQESQHDQQPEEQHGSEHAVVTQPTQDGKLSQLQPPNEALTEGDIKLISKKTGKEMKSNINQTSFIWERKPLAEILYPPSEKTLSPEKDTASPEAGEIKQAPGQEVFPSGPLVEEQELQHGSQQLEALESKQDGGQEAPTETQAAPEDAPEAPEEVLEVPEEAPKEALEAPEEAPEEAAEAPEESPEAPDKAPEALGETPENSPEAPEEAAKDGSEAPEEPSES